MREASEAGSLRPHGVIGKVGGLRLCLERKGTRRRVISRVGLDQICVLQSSHWLQWGNGFEACITYVGGHNQGIARVQERGCCKLGLG